MIECDHPDISVRRQCALIGLHRSTFYSEPVGESALNLHLMRLLDEIERARARQRLFDQGMLGAQRQELLGSRRGAHGPKARAHAPRQDRDPEVGEAGATRSLRGSRRFGQGASWG